MSQVVAAVVHTFVVGGIVYAVICRARHMDDQTRPEVMWQHRLLAASALLSICPGIDADWRAAIIGIGALGFMLLSTSRWRMSAPPGTRRG